MKRKKGDYRRILTAVVLLGLLLPGCSTTEEKQTTETPPETTMAVPQANPPEKQPDTEPAVETVVDMKYIPEPTEEEYPALAEAFFASYAVPMPEVIPETGVVEGYKLVLPYIPVYAGDVFYQEISLPQLVSDSPAAQAWNREIVTDTYRSYWRYLTILEDGPVDCGFSVELTWEAYTSGDVTVVARRNTCGYDGSGAWSTVYDMVYFDNGTETFLTQAEFLARHTNGAWTPGTVLEALNKNAVSTNERNEPHTISEKDVQGFIPADNGAFYVAYQGFSIEGRFASVALFREGAVERLIGVQDAYRYPWLDVFRPHDGYSQRMFAHRIQGTDDFLLGYAENEPLVYLAKDGTFTKLEIPLVDTWRTGEAVFHDTTVIRAEDTGVNGEARIIVELYALLDSGGQETMYEYVAYRYHTMGTTPVIEYAGPLTAAEVAGQPWVHSPNRNGAVK